MATPEEFQALMDAIGNDANIVVQMEAEQLAEIANLKAQLAGGVAITQEQLDVLYNRGSEIKAKLDAIATPVVPA